jgi:glycosyltransferase involved in cell wall biosynthesis
MTPLRALFLSEGELGTSVMGPAAVAAALEGGLASDPDIDPTFLGLPPMGRLAAAASWWVPGLGRWDLDLQPVRWHVVQALRARRFIDAAVAERPADVLHVNSHAIALGLGSRMQDIPTVLAVDVTVADWQAMGVWRSPRPWSHALLTPSLRRERRVLAAAAAVLAFSEWSAAGVRRANPDVAVEVVHPGLDLHAYRPGPRPSRRRPRLLFVGGRFVEKGGPDLLAAVRPLLGEKLDLDLVTPAPVPEEPGVRVHRLGPGDPELRRLYREADLFCLPTPADAVPWAVLEAMASGTPVVTTTVGALPELVGTGPDAAGTVVPPRDRATLHDAIVALVEDPLHRAELGENARVRVERRFDRCRQADRLTEILHRVAR